MKTLKVKTYELKGEQIVVRISNERESCEYEMKRSAFEDWLTEGSGVVDMSICHNEGGVLTEVPIKESIETYWLQGEEVNNSPVLEHLHMYLQSDELQSCSVKAELLEERLRGLFEVMTPLRKAEAYAALLEYGLLKRESGMWSARRRFS